VKVGALVRYQGKRVGIHPHRSEIRTGKRKQREVADGKENGTGSGGGSHLQRREKKGIISQGPTEKKSMLGISRRRARGTIASLRQHKGKN